MTVFNEIAWRQPIDPKTHDELWVALNAAEARIRELEQEKAQQEKDDTSWFPESFVIQLQAQVAHLQAELAALNGAKQ